MTALSPMPGVRIILRFFHAPAENKVLVSTVKFRDITDLIKMCNIVQVSLFCFLFCVLDSSLYSTRYLLSVPVICKPTCISLL